MSRAVLILFMSVVLLGLVSCGGEQEKGAANPEDSSEVLARVGDQSITQADFDLALSALPGGQQGAVKSITGKKRFLDELVKRKLIMMEAEDAGLHKRHEVAKRLEDFRERLLTHEYNNYLLAGLPQPTEQQMKAYYDSHRSQYVILARVNASWVKCETRGEAEDARARILAGEKITTVAREVTIDECSKKDGGMLGYFNPTGYIRCIGKNPAFAKKAFELEADDVGEVFNWQGGYAFIRVNEKTTERPEPFNKARERIQGLLRPRLTDSLMAKEFTRLGEKYPVKTFYNLADALEGKSADELMRAATETNNPQDRIDYYTVLLNKYPQYGKADEAQFMMAFVYSEELKDYDTARVEFQKVLDGYPESEIRESALFMLQNLGRQDIPKFEGTDMTP